MTIYYADGIGQANNCLYPHRAEIRGREDLERAVSRDYVCAQYRGNYRSNGNFLQSDCLAADCDNDHSEKEDDWVWPADVAEAFPGVRFAVHYSRNHMKEKGGRPARPKFHVLFPIRPVTDAKAYGDMKKQVCEIFPFFDANALDAARFFFGMEPAQADLFPGPRTLTEFLQEDEAFDRDTDAGAAGGSVIPEGRWNATLSRCAGKILKRLGDSEEARARFDALAEKCVPPLE